jgi:hypothetical protein
LFLTFRATSPLVLHLRTHLAGVDLGDPVHILSVIGWNYHSLIQGFENYWTPPYFYPHRLTLAYSEHFFIPSFLVAPVIYLAGDLVLAYNILFTLSFTLCGFGNFLLVRYLTGNRLAGILGGIVFAYSTYMLSHFAQLSYLVAQWIPFTFFYLLKYFENRTYKNWLLFILFYLFQVLSSAYYGLFLTVFTGIFILAFGVKQEVFKTSRFWKQFALFLVIVLPIFYLFFYPYIVVKDHMGFQRSLGEVHYFSANIRDYARVMPNNYLYGNLLNPPGVGTTSPFWLFPGVTALFLGFLGLSDFRVLWGALILRSLSILLLIGFFLLFALGLEAMAIPLLALGSGWVIYALYEGKRQKVGGQEADFKTDAQITEITSGRHRTLDTGHQTTFHHRLFLISFIFAILFSFGPIMSFHEKEIPYGPYFLLYYLIPGFGGIRVVSRFNVMVTFFLGILAGLGLSKLLNRISSKYIRGMVGIFLITISFLEHIPESTWIVPINFHNPTPEEYTWLRNHPGDFVIVELPWKPVDIKTAYYAIATHKKKTIGGYSSFIPPFTSWFFQQMEAFPSESSLKMIRAMGARYVVVHNREFLIEKKKSDIPLQLQSSSRFLKLVQHFSSSDTYVYEVLDVKDGPFNLETTQDPIHLIFPDPVFSLQEVQAFLDVPLAPGDLRLSPYPEFNSRVILRWIQSTTRSIACSQQAKLSEKFLLTENDHGLPFIVRTPPISGTFMLEVYDEAGKRLLDKKQVIVN